jgi:hypothetical protein
VEVQVLSSAWNPREGVSRSRRECATVILLYPLVLAGALILLWKSRARGLGAAGWPWFAAWAVAGAVFMLSLLTGFSIGLFLFPAATVAIFWLAVNAPYLREVSGFLIGLGAVLLVVALI